MPDTYFSYLPNVSTSMMPPDDIVHLNSSDNIAPLPTHTVEACGSGFASSRVHGECAQSRAMLPAGGNNREASVSTFTDETHARD